MGQVKPKKQKVKRYAPELGQYMLGSQAWRDYEMPEYAEALLNYIFEEIERIYWNINPPIRPSVCKECDREFMNV